MSVKVVKEGKETLGEIIWCEKDLKDSTHLGIWLEVPIGNIGVSLPVGELDNENLKEFSNNIRNKVKFTQDRSLYKYLRELLDLADQFICSDIGYIGYVISHPDPENDTKIIAISHSAHVGGQEKEELEEKYLVHDSVNKYKDLRYFQVNPTEQEKKTCMAYCFNNQDQGPFLLRHNDDDDMSPEEIKAKQSGHYAHFDKSITAELTVPIVVNGEVKIIMNFETTEEKAPTFNKVSRKLLELFAKEVGIAFNDAIFKNPKMFLSLFYHAAIHKIMGQYNNAAKEFDTWRQVQCQDIFLQNPFNKDLFMGFKDFYRYLASSFQCNPLATGAVYEGLINSGVKKLFRTTSLSEDGEGSLENKLEFGFPFFALLKIYNLCDSDTKLKEKWGNKIENIYQLIIDKSVDSQLVELPEPQTVTEFSEIYNKWFVKKKKVFEDWRNNSFEYMDEETFFQFYINLNFLIRITEITRIQKILEEGTALTFEELNVVSPDDKAKLHDIIITCSTLILWENVKLSKKQKQIEEQEKEQKLMSVPLILAYLYRGEAFLMLNEKRKAYNDFTLLERFVETRDIKYSHTRWLPSVSNKSNDDRGENFKQWLKALLKHQKGKVYFAAFAHRKALSSFCGMMDIYKEFKEIIIKRQQNIPFQYVMVEAMLYKGKLFLDIGSFQRSLKWFLKGIREILPDEYKSESLKGFPLYSLAERLLQSLIDKLEEFKHNAIIKKGELIDKLWIFKNDIIAEKRALKEIHEEEYDLNLWSKYFKSSNKEQRILLTECLFSEFKGDPSKSKNAKLLSDFCNRIGFVLFLINLYPTKYSSSQCEEINKKIQFVDENGGNKKIDLASEWIDWAIKFNPHNGFAMFNKWLVDFDRDKFQGYSEDQIKKEFPITLKQERFYRRFYPIFLHTIHKKFPANEPMKSFQRVAYQLSRYLLTYIDDLIKKPAEVYSYLTREGLLRKKERIDGLYSLERWSSWAPKLPRPRMFSCRGGGKLLVWNGKGIAIDPGFDFLTNLYDECFSLEDIDAICITHDHSDHTDDFDAICRLIKEYRRVLGDKKQLVLLVNPGFSQKCSHYLKEAEAKGEVKHVYLLNHDTTIDLDEFYLSIKVLRAIHSEQHTEKYAVGLIFQLKEEPDDKPVIEIGFTSDTRYPEENTEESKKFKRDFEKLASCDMVVANISHATFRELKGILELKLNEDSLYQGFWNQLKEEERQNNDIIRILKWALWYGDEEKIDAIWKDENLSQQQVGKGKGILATHLGISGINKAWEQIKENSSDRIEGCKLMIISEFREELGSFRSKLAQLLNKCSGSENARCYTSDIGMAIRFEKHKNSNK